MAKVMIRCVASGRQVFTGIETSAASLNLIPPINTRLTCPACGSTHIWSILDAELVMEEFDCPEDMPLDWSRRLARLERL
jgi:predicted RNA-binding Zn-ribbon protein involved in translation (DUF1610 family)